MSENVHEVKAALDASAGDAHAKRSRQSAIRIGIAAVSFIILIVVVNALTHGDFFTAGNLTNVLRQITYNAILAVGQTFVIITAGIDLSVGSLIELTGVVMAQFANASGLDGPLLVIVTTLVGILAGCCAGLVNALPVVRLNLPPFITTLAMMLMARGLAFKLAHGQPVPLKSSAFDALGTQYALHDLLSPLGLPGIPWAVMVMLAVVIVFAIVLNRTRFGRYVLALGGNEEAARLAGINVRLVKAFVYVISGGCAGLAGMLLMARFSSGSPQTGIGSELQSIAAVVVGGTSLMGGRGSVLTSFFGALLIGVLNNVMNLLNIESYTQDIVLGAVILLAVTTDEYPQADLRPLMVTSRIFDDLSIAELRKRRSAKWSRFPADVLPAWVAEMDFPLADAVRATLLEAIAHDDCGYANDAGVGAAFARFAQTRFGWTLDPRGVVVIPDVLVGIAEILRALAKPGDRVVVNSPVYPPFYRTVDEVERRIEDVPLLRGESGWELDLPGLERSFAGGAAVYLLCSPHNPLGKVFDVPTLTRIAELARGYGVLVIADEIHAPLTMAGATFAPFLPIADALDCDALALSSASKAWNLPGLKCALAIAGTERMRQRLAAIRPASVGNLGVIASLAAFDHGGAWLDALLGYLDRNRRLLADLLAAELPGVRYVPPQASYLAWLDCTALELGPDPMAVFLERSRVALTRGRDFGPQSGAFVRLNMGTSAAILTEIVHRMRRAI